MNAHAPPVRLLHLHSSFSLGGKEARAARLMNLMGVRAHHAILSAVPDALGARDAIDPSIVVDFPTDAPPLHGKPGLRRYRDLVRYMQRFDLVLSYNWGAMDGVMAHRIFAPFRDLPPLIHHEDGFNEDETARRNWKRNGFRRLALPTADALVVPSKLLAAIAAREWNAGAHIRLIANGIDVARYGREATMPIAGLEPCDSDVIIGTVAGLRKVKDLSRLVRAVAPLPPHVRLVIVGEGPEADEIRSTATACGMSDRLVMPGFMADPASWIGHFDLLALSSQSEQAPIAVIEAMAAGLPVVSPRVGDIAAMVSDDNRRYIAKNDADFRAALKVLAGDAPLRKAIGRANRTVAETEYDEARMVAAYEKLYETALGGRRLFARN